MRPASATFEAIEAEALLKVWDVLHLRAVWEGVGVSEVSGVGLSPSDGLRLIIKCDATQHGFSKAVS